jgi:chaperonin GroEL
LEDIQLSDFGRVGEVSITKDNILLLKGKGSEDKIGKRVEQIKDQVSMQKNFFPLCCWHSG